MAFTTPAVTKDTVHGRTCYRVTFTGTSIAAATEATITGLPLYGRVVCIRSNSGAGDRTKTRPILGEATAPSGTSIIVQAADVAGVTSLNENPDYPGGTYYSATGTLYYRLTPDGGSNNTDDVVIHVLAGWGQ